MKKISYKAAAVILCLIMVLGLNACGGGENASETAESSRAESVEAAETESAGTAETAAQEETADRAPAVITIYSTNDIHGVVAEPASLPLITVPM